MEPKLVIKPNGLQHWILGNRLHRVDGPAIIHPDGSEAWHQNNKRHRTDGPAIVDSNGYRAWYQDGRLHRVDGPAVIWPDKSVEYWAFDTRYQSLEELNIGIVMNQ